MPRWIKLLLLSCAAGVAAFVALLVYTLTDTVRDVTGYDSLRAFLNKPLSLKRPCFLIQRDAHQYRFTEYELTADAASGGRLMASLQPGTAITLHQFKTYTNAESGFGHLYALGTVAVAGKLVDFEYLWSGLNLLDEPYDAPIVLPVALWQDSTAAETIFIKKD